MNDQDQINEEERQEAATETPAFLGCPQHMPTHLPGGFDGVGSATETVQPHGGGTRGEGVPPSQKVNKLSDLEKMNEALFDRLGKIMDLARDVRHDLIVGNKTNEEDNIKLLGAFSELRQMCDFYKPSEKPLDPTAPEMERGKGRLFKSKHTSSCRGTYIYDRVVINGAHLRADLHFDNGGLEQHGSVYVDDSPRAFCFVTFNTSGATKCDYAMRGLLAGIAKRLVYHHKNLIKRKAKWAAAKAAKKGGAK